MSGITRIDTTVRSSRTVIYNGIVLVDGMTAEDCTQDITGRAKQTLARIEKYLALAGTDKSRLLTAQIWLKDICNDFNAMNAVWNAWTAPDTPPTWATC